MLSFSDWGFCDVPQMTAPRRRSEFFLCVQFSCQVTCSNLELCSTFERCSALGCSTFERCLALGCSTFRLSFCSRNDNIKTNRDLREKKTDRHRIPIKIVSCILSSSQSCRSCTQTHILHGSKTLIRHCLAKAAWSCCKIQLWFS